MSTHSYQLTTTPEAVRWLIAELGQRGLSDFALKGRRLVRVSPTGRIITFEASADDLVAALTSHYEITRNSKEVLFPIVAARLALRRLPEARELKDLHEHPLRGAA